MHAGPAKGILFSLTQDFARHRGRVPLAERQELQQVRDRVAFRPSEVHVRDSVGPIANVEEERRDRVNAIVTRMPMPVKMTTRDRVASAHSGAMP